MKRMQITHEEARRLIQFKADGGLEPVNEERLHAHLTACTECRSHLDAVAETESVLRQTLRKQWNARPLPLQMDVIYGKVNSRNGVSAFLTTRKALIGVVSLFFAFFAWQSMTTRSTPPVQNIPGTVPLIPTPSLQYQYTATSTLREDCSEIRYIVQEGDRLEDIARQFSVSKADILSANDLENESIIPMQELVIPACGTTPTGTIYPPTFTITPNFETIPTTPG
jgi:hypothetical protein